MPEITRTEAIEALMREAIESMTPEHLHYKILKRRVCIGPGCSVTFMPRRKDKLYHNVQCRKAAWFERNYVARAALAPAPQIAAMVNPIPTQPKPRKKPDPGAAQRTKRENRLRKEFLGSANIEEMVKQFGTILNLLDANRA